MQCRNHPEALAVDRCAGCSEAFCGSCLVDMRGQKYCGDCKVMAVDAVPVVEEATIPCKEAGEALTYAIVGLFCFGFILEPMAIIKALAAKKKMRLNPQFSGSGKATAALIIAIVGCVLWVFGMIAQFAQIAAM